MNCYRVGVFRLGFCSFISVGAEQLHLIVAGVLVKFDRQNSMDVAESSSAASAANNSSRNNNSTSSFFFPPAAQPEVMRAAEKDEYYVASLCDACHEAFRHAMGEWILDRLLLSILELGLRSEFHSSVLERVRLLEHELIASFAFNFSFH